VGSPWLPCTYRTTVETEYDSTDLKDDVSEGQVLDKSDSGAKGPLYISSVGTHEVEITEVF